MPPDSEPLKPDPAEVTLLLERLAGDRSEAADELLPVVYDELRRLAAYKLKFEPPGQTLQATALVHEAWLRIVGSADPGWDNRAVFFAAAAEAMRRILIDRARSKKRLKRGEGQRPLNLDEIDVAIEMPSEVLLALDEALGRLEASEPQAVSLIKLRFFAGIPHGEAAEILGLSRRSADRLWAFARAWLFREVKRQL